jgi:hypothetical protein
MDEACIRYAHLHNKHRKSMDLIERPVSISLSVSGRLSHQKSVTQATIHKSVSLPILVQLECEYPMLNFQDGLILIPTENTQELIEMASPKLQHMLTNVTQTQSSKFDVDEVRKTQPMKQRCALRRIMSCFILA